MQPMIKQKLIATLVSLTILIPAMASAQEIPKRFQPTLDAFLEAAKSECAALNNGIFEVVDGGIQFYADFNQDGISDPIIDTRAFSCSSSATLFVGGTGGHYINAFVSDDDKSYKQFQFLAQDSAVIALGGTAVLVLKHHGTSCNLQGLSPCFAAYSWAEGKFNTANAIIHPQQQTGIDQ